MLSLPGRECGHCGQSPVSWIGELLYVWRGLCWRSSDVWLTLSSLHDTTSCAPGAYCVLLQLHGSMCRVSERSTAFMRAVRPMEYAAYGQLCNAADRHARQDSGQWSEKATGRQVDMQPPGRPTLLVRFGQRRRRMLEQQLALSHRVLLPRHGGHAAHDNHRHRERFSVGHTHLFISAGGVPNDWLACVSGDTASMNANAEPHPTSTAA